MSLNDSIQKYIKGLSADQYYPTLLRLATHSSGYSERLPLSGREYFRLVLGLISGSGDMKRNNPLHMDFNKMKLLIEKNKVKDMDYPWKYSNFGMSPVGYALGVVSSKGY
jgi:CubicO group peptidase (beta-lactamase class C family)